MSKGQVVVAMSGGVDSSVAAALLTEAGYEVIGVTMRLWPENQPDLPPLHRSCCSIEAIDDARRVCQILDIPYYVLNFEREFRTHVVNYFWQDYQRGRTPNPCLACNQWIKFRYLLQKVLALGANYLATGHYARIERRNGKYNLLKGLDRKKDQSYMLYVLRQKELVHLLLPLGQYEKAEVRRLAAHFRLPVADKPDSQEICFVPDNDYRNFLRGHLNLSPGDVVDGDGRVLGKHGGIALYTVGQRHGLGLSTGKRLYVIAIDAERNRLIVGPEAQLFGKALLAEEVNFLSGEGPREPIGITAKIRYKSPDAPAKLFPRETGVEISFENPQRAITSGQAVVFYQSDLVVGGGIIAGAVS